MLILSRQRSGRFGVGGRFSPVVSPGGEETRIAFDALTLHPDAWYSDDFDFPDTATWEAAQRAKPTWKDGWESHMEFASIDNSVQFNGRPTLKITAGSGSFGMYFEKDTTCNVMWLRYGFTVPAAFDAKALFTPNICDATFAAEEGATWDSLEGGGSGGWIDTFTAAAIVAQTAASIKAGGPVWVVKCERLDAANIRITYWKDGSFCVVLDKEAATEGLRILEILKLVVDDIGVTNPIINVNRIEAIDGDGRLLPPYTGLEDPQMRVMPADVMVAPGATMQFAAIDSVDGTEVTADSWECTGGTIDSSGLFTAGIVEGEFSVTPVKAGMGLSAPAIVEVSSFDPTDLTLEAWPDVDAANVADGDPISLTGDLSGLNHKLGQSGAARPLCRAGVLNGYDVAEFDGVDDNLNNASQYVAAYGARTTYVVARLLTEGNFASVVFMHSGGYFRIYALKGQGADTDGWNFTPDGADALLVQLGGDPSAWSLVACRINSALSMDVALNDGAWINATPASAIWSAVEEQSVKLGQHVNSDSAYCQSPGFVQVASAVSDANHRKIRRFLNGKYGGLLF